MWTEKERENRVKQQQRKRGRQTCRNGQTVTDKETYRRETGSLRQRQIYRNRYTETER